MRQSLYRQSDDELSLIVFNDYSLYLMRHEKSFIRYLSGIYQYTKKQKAVLKADLLSDKEEISQSEKVVVS